MANWWESIRDSAVQIKTRCSTAPRDLLTALLIVFVGAISFGLGRHSAVEQQMPLVRITEAEQVAKPPLRIGGKIAASQHGSKYHYPWCVGARAMNEENKIWFDSIQEARQAGYTPAGNCSGLE